MFRLYTVAQKCHGNFNLLTAFLICSRLFQFAHGNFNFAYGDSNFAYGNFNFAHGNFISLTMSLNEVDRLNMTKNAITKQREPCLACQPHLTSP